MSIEIKGKPTRELFFKEEDDFGIYGIEVNPDYRDEVKLNMYGNISIKGTFPRLDLYQEYTFFIKEDTASNAYKGSYILESLKKDRPTTTSEQKIFLSSILTENQVNNIYEVYGEDEDVIKLIEDGQFDYKKVHGIGDKVFEKLRKKVLDNIDISDVLIFLSKYGIKYNMISKLVKEYGNPHVVINKIEENPYLLTEVKGIGFKKADSIAKSVGYDMKSGHRIESCIKFCITEENANGHCWLEYKQLLNKALELLNIPKKYIEETLKNGVTDVLVVDGNKYTLKHIYETEKFIAMKMIQYKTNSKKFAETEELNKFLDNYCKENSVELEENQRQFFHDWNENNILILVGGGGCVDKDTEFFNGKEWKKISEYDESDYVLQYDNDGNSKLVKPLKFHKLKSEFLTMVKNETGSINQCLSDEHNFVYETSKGNLAIKDFSEIKKIHNNSKLGFYGQIRTTFNYDGEGLDLSDDNIRLMIAVIADGNFPNKSGNKCRINIKKQRKKDRLEKLLRVTNTSYKKTDKDDGFSVYIFEAPRRMKEYNEEWYKCNKKQLEIISNEVMHWDGSVQEGRGGTFFSNSKCSVDFIQFVYSSLGKRATLSTRIRDNKNTEYYVTVSKNNKISMKTKEGSPKLQFKEYKTLDGYKYCFTMDSGMWVMRRNGRIAITGNCGKSWLQNILLNFIDTKNKNVALLAPTGK